MATAWFEGIDELYRLAGTLNRSTGRIGATASMVLRKTARSVEATAKVLCPVDTGNLRNSIGTVIVGDGRRGVMEADVGTDVEYAPYVEFGTARMAPQPYLKPAFDEHVPAFLAALEQLGDPLPGPAEGPVGGS